MLIEPVGTGKKNRRRIWWPNTVAEAKAPHLPQIAVLGMCLQFAAPEAGKGAGWPPELTVVLEKIFPRTSSCASHARFNAFRNIQSAGTDPFAISYGAQVPVCVEASEPSDKVP